MIETSALHAGYPDNQGRDNPASQALMGMIARGKADMRTLFNAPDGQVFVGESGTELLFRYALGGTASSNPYAALAMPALSRSY